MPFTPVLEAHHSERRDVIKGRSKTGRSDKSRVRPLRQPVEVRMIIVAVALARGRA